MTNKDQFEKNFKLKGGRLKMKPSEKSWLRIENRLSKRRKRSGLSIWNVGIAACLVLLISVGSIFYFSSASHNSAKALATFNVEPLLESDQKANIDPVDLNRLYADMKAENKTQQEKDQSLKVN